MPGHAANERSPCPEDRRGPLCIGRLVARATIWALHDMLDAADREDRKNEEERDKAHALLADEVRGRATLPTA